MSGAGHWSRPTIAAPTAELVMELKVLIGPAVTVGKTAEGTRRFVPITGGSFEGAAIRGDVIPGGADWQLTRGDGVTEIEAIYAIRADDGAVIAVRNRGLVAPAPPGGSSGAPYVRTTPVFQAPQGGYEWLNQRVFTGTIAPSAARDFVTVHVFRID